MSLKSIVAVLLLPLLFASCGLGQTADSIIARSIEATGGEKVIKDVKSYHLIGVVELPANEMELPAHVFGKYPGFIKYIADFQGQEVVQATDGTTAWMINPMLGSTDAIKMPESRALSLIRVADMDGFFFNFQKRGISYRYGGKKKLDGKDHDVVVFTYDNGDINQGYYDESGHMVALWSSGEDNQGNTVDLWTLYSDFRVLPGGMMFPFRIESRTNDQTNLVLKWEKSEVNIPLDDSLFTMPSPAAESEEQAQPASSSSKE